VTATIDSEDGSSLVTLSTGTWQTIRFLEFIGRCLPNLKWLEIVPTCPDCCDG